MTVEVGAVGLGVRVDVTVPVDVMVGVRVIVGVCVGVCVEVKVGLGDGSGEAVGMGGRVMKAIRVGVAVGCALRPRTSGLRPCAVSQPQPHSSTITISSANNNRASQRRRRAGRPEGVDSSGGKLNWNWSKPIVPSELSSEVLVICAGSPLPPPS